MFMAFNSTHIPTRVLIPVAKYFNILSPMTHFKKICIEIEIHLVQKCVQGFPFRETMVQ